jgi:glutathione peroxidase-family protein
METTKWDFNYNVVDTDGYVVKRFKDKESAKRFIQEKPGLSLSKIEHIDWSNKEDECLL